MTTVINIRKNAEVNKGLKESLAELLPYKLYGEIREQWEKNGLPEEIRCRKNRYVYVTADGKNKMLGYFVTEEDIKRMTDKLVGSSLYAHKDTIAEGYVTLHSGIRVGMIGRASVENGKIIGVYDIGGLNIRLPQAEIEPGASLCALIRKKGTVGALIYSAPGEGKTTLLKSIARNMSGGQAPLRVCVVDERGELTPYLCGKGLSLDVLSGYPKEKGIEIATRTMNAQLVLCDEIGSYGEAEAILRAQNCGVPLIATAHGQDLGMLLRKKGIRTLHDQRVFELYVGIKRRGRNEDYDYMINEWEMANELL